MHTKKVKAFRAEPFISVKKPIEASWPLQKLPGKVHEKMHLHYPLNNWGLRKQQATQKKEIYSKFSLWKLKKGR